MAKLQQLGCDKTVVGRWCPLATRSTWTAPRFTLDHGGDFIAQACGIDLTLTQELTILGVLLLTSKGDQRAGVTGSGFITLAATLATVPTIPVAGLDADSGHRPLLCPKPAR